MRERSLTQQGFACLGRVHDFIDEDDAETRWQWQRFTGESEVRNVSMWFDETGQFWVIHGTTIAA